MPWRRMRRSSSHCCNCVQERTVCLKAGTVAFSKSQRTTLPSRACSSAGKALPSTSPHPKSGPSRLEQPRPDEMPRCLRNRPVPTAHCSTPL
eukprot:4570433-Alexandrium_andersonii.AAC.1